MGFVLGFIAGLIVGVVLMALVLAGVIYAMYQEGLRQQEEIERLTMRE